MQQQIRAEHLSRATLYALMMNCLQFGKEAYTNPGNSATNRTRAMACELLAIKLLKQFTTVELVRPLVTCLQSLSRYGLLTIFADRYIVLHSCLQMVADTCLTD